MSVNRDLLEAALNGTYSATWGQEVILAAARERLAQLEHDALVIEKDADGAWPEWAVRAVVGPNSPTSAWVYEGVDRLDALHHQADSDMGKWQSAVRVATGREAGTSDEITYRCTVHERIARQLDDGRLICDQGEIEKHTQKVREHCRFEEVRQEE